MIRLESGETVVREWQEGDAEDLALQANDRRIWLTLRDAFPHPYGLQDAKNFIAMARGRMPATFFAVLTSGQIARGRGGVRGRSNRPVNDPLIAGRQAVTGPR